MSDSQNDVNSQASNEIGNQRRIQEWLANNEVTNHQHQPGGENNDDATASLSLSSSSTNRANENMEVYHPLDFYGDELGLGSK